MHRAPLAFGVGPFAASALLALFAGSCHSSASNPAGLELPRLTYNGGGVLASPQVVSVTFSNDTLAPELQAFGASLTSSSWWSEVVSGYCTSGSSGCVGAGSNMSVSLSTAAATSYTDSVSGGSSSLQDWLKGAISGGMLPSPAAGGDVSSTLYEVYFPMQTTVTLDGVTSCSDIGFGGYHSVFQPTGSGSQLAAYTVVDECGVTSTMPLPGVPVDTVLQDTTIDASHELVEAVTDPNPPHGWALDDTVFDNWGWIDVTGGGEAADMCVDLLGLDQDQTTEGSYTVQRIWSNGRIAQRADPCIPATANDVYFNAAPTRAFFVLDVGASASFDVEPFSWGQMDDWTVQVADWSDTEAPDFLSFTIEGGMTSTYGPYVQVNDGSTVHVTVTLTQDPSQLQPGEADGSIVSFAGSANAPTAAHFWPFAVMSTAEAANEGISPGTTQSIHHRKATTAPRRGRRMAPLGM